VTRAPLPRGRDGRRRNALTGAVSVAAHAVAIAVLVSAAPHPPPMPEPEPMVVALVSPPHPPEIPAPPTDKPPTPEPPPPPPPRNIARPAKRPPLDAQPIPAGKGPKANGESEVSDAELASASTAGAGGGRSCNMTQWLQSALRKDPRVQATMAEMDRGKAVRVWNGDWVRHGDQEGNGLAAVREAIMWEVGFAPLACRNEPVKGLVAISLNDGPAAARMVMGQGEWRWADLLFSRSSRP
jgi:type IV secretory pathway VirB10-like protein